MTSGGARLGGHGALSPVTAPLSLVTSGRRPADRDAPLSVMPWSFGNSCVRHCQAAHLQRELVKAGPGNVWRVLRPIIGSKKEAGVPSATPDALNDYYVSIGPATAASVPRPTTPTPHG